MNAATNTSNVIPSPRIAVHNQQGAPLTSAQNTSGTFSNKPDLKKSSLPKTEPELRANLETAFVALQYTNTKKEIEIEIEIAGDDTKGYAIHHKSMNPTLEVKITPQQVVTAVTYQEI